MAPIGCLQCSLDNRLWQQTGSLCELVTAVLWKASVLFILSAGRERFCGSASLQNFWATQESSVEEQALLGHGQVCTNLTHYSMTKDKHYFILVI